MSEWAAMFTAWQFWAVAGAVIFGIIILDRRYWNGIKKKKERKEEKRNY